MLYARVPVLVLPMGALLYMEWLALSGGLSGDTGA